MNIYERAARAKLRFTSTGTPTGELATEHLFDLPLTSTGNRASLDKIARDVHGQLKQFDECSFVETKPNPEKIAMELRLEILKAVIESKKADAKAAETRAQRAQLRERLTEALATKEGEQLKGKSVDELRKQLAELDE